MKYGENLCEACPISQHLENDNPGRIDFDLVEFADNTMEGVPENLERLAAMEADFIDNNDQARVALYEWLIDDTDPKKIAQPMLDLNIDRRTLTGRAFIGCREKVLAGTCLHFANKKD
jgi:hypothetical protein